MEILEIVGIESSQGQYQGFNYNNVKFHCLNGAKKIIAGTMTEIVKMKSDVYMGDLNVGDKVSFIYDKNGRVVSYEVV